MNTDRIILNNQTYTMYMKQHGIPEYCTVCGSPSSNYYNWDDEEIYCAVCQVHYQYTFVPRFFEWCIYSTLVEYSRGIMLE